LRTLAFALKRPSRLARPACTAPNVVPAVSSVPRGLSHSERHCPTSLNHPLDTTVHAPLRAPRLSAALLWVCCSAARRCGTAATPQHHSTRALSAPHHWLSHRAVCTHTAPQRTVPTRARGGRFELGKAPLCARPLHPLHCRPAVAYSQTRWFPRCAHPRCKEVVHACDAARWLAEASAKALSGAI
jgi:hypothetical protein